MKFISMNYDPWNILIRTKNKNYLARALHTSGEELEAYYNRFERARIYLNKSRTKMTLSFYREKNNKSSKSSVYIYTFREKTNEELLELGCSF